MPTFIPGWEATISVDTQDIGIVCNVLNFARTRASQPKPVFGSPFRNEIPGQASGTMSLQGHVSVEELPKLEAIFDKTTAVPYTIQVGTVGGATEAGSYAGSCSITGYTLDDDAEGEWEFTLDATLDGAPVYTPPTP